MRNRASSKLRTSALRRTENKHIKSVQPLQSLWEYTTKPQGHTIMQLSEWQNKPANDKSITHNPKDKKMQTNRNSQRLLISKHNGTSTFETDATVFHKVTYISHMTW